MEHNNEEKQVHIPFASLDTLYARWKDGTFQEIIDDWKWIFSYSARYKGAIAFYTLLGIFSVTLGLAGSVASKYVIDIITGYQTSKLGILLIIMIGSTLFLVGVEIDGSYVKNANSCSMCKRLIINSGISQVCVRDDADNYRLMQVSDWVEHDESLDGSFGY